MMKTGRKSILTPALTKKICALLREGCDQKTAASICGIAERTFHSWKERGRDDEEPYAAFFDAASRARNTYKARLLKIVIEAADKDARHAEWLLEKGWPREFGCEPEPETSVFSEQQFSKLMADLQELPPLNLAG